MKKGEALLNSENTRKAVLGLALPAVLSSMIATIYNLTDTWFIGRLNSTVQLSAVSLAAPWMWIISGLSMIISAGAPKLISMALGRGDRAKAASLGHTDVLGTIAVSVPLALLGYLLIGPVLRLMGAEGEIVSLAADYLRPILLCVPLTAPAGAFQGILRAGGFAARATVGYITGIIVNVILDPILILSCGMGVRGAAIATAIGGCAATLVCAVLALPEIRGKGSGLRGTFLPSLKQGIPSTIAGLIEALTVGLALSFATGYGEAKLASISVAARIYALFISLIAAFAYSLQPLIGYHYAGRRWERLGAGLRFSLLVGTLVGTLGAVSFILVPGTWMGLFSEDPDVLAFGNTVLRCLAIGMPVTAIQMCADAYLSSTGKVAKALIAGVGRQVGIFLPCLWILRALFDEAGMILSYPATDLLATILSVLLAGREWRNALRGRGDQIKVENVP